MSGYTAYWMASLLSRHLPGRSAYWVGLRVADAFHRWHHRDRQAVMANIGRILEARGIQPASENLAGLTRKTFQYFGKYLVDFFRFTRLRPEDIRRWVSIERLDHLADAHRLGRGVLVVTAHFGNWEMGGAVLASLGYTVNAVVMPQRMRRLERLLSRQREERGMRILPVGQAALGILRCLKRGELVALLADRDFSKHTETVGFFGQPARLPQGAAALALRTGAPIVPAFMMRQEDDTFLLRLHPAIRPEQEGTLENIMNRIAASMEKEIGERPYQWFIFRNFWSPDVGTQPGENQP